MVGKKSVDFLSLNKEPRGKYLEQVGARARAWAQDWARAWAEAWTQAQAHCPGLHLRLIIDMTTA